MYIYRIHKWRNHITQMMASHYSLQIIIDTLVKNKNYTDHKS